MKIEHGIVVGKSSKDFPPHAVLPPHGLHPRWIMSNFAPQYQGFAMDIGASDGISINSTIRLEQAGWTVLCVEANPVFYPRLKEMRALVETCACGSKDSEQETFHTYDWSPEAYSALKPSHPSLPETGWSEIKVPVRTVETLLKRANFPHLDVMCIDVEGGEMEVLEGFDINKWKPKVMIVESWKGDRRVKEYLSGFGYEKAGQVLDDELFVLKKEPGMAKIKDLSESTPLPGGYEITTQCRACYSPNLTKVLNLGEQYIANFVKEPNPLLPKAPVELILCGKCGLLQLSVSVDPKLLWTGDYWYRSSVNQTMRDALSSVVNAGVRYHDSGTWIDIGANDGFLLSRVPSNFKKIGVEPSKSLLSLLEEHADLTVNGFFSAEGLEKANVITSCAMFYDVDDPGRFCRDIAKVLTDDGIWINQLSHAEGMIKSMAFDAICHEHKAYYSLASLQRIYHESGLQIIEVSENDVNGGSLRVIAKRGNGLGNYLDLSRDEIFAFAQKVPKWKARMQWLIDCYLDSGMDIWGLGASTKACCLLQFLDRNDSIVAIADRNPIKDGLKMAGTWLPITNEDTMREAKPAVLFSLIWAFRHELVAREKDLLSGGTHFLFPLPNIEIII